MAIFVTGANQLNRNLDHKLYIIFYQVTAWGQDVYGWAVQACDKQCHCQVQTSQTKITTHHLHTLNYLHRSYIDNTVITLLLKLKHC